ncbi:MAG: peptidoglycan-associated lipoprotein Pal [Deltaproteobacteria bacterium]|nr:peptidoglycan-associated lipoprotein Pal [Deltaproteobacteria bacterium]
MKKMMTVILVVAFTCAAIFMLASCAKKQIGMEQAVTPAQAAPTRPAPAAKEPAAKEPAPQRTGLENEIRAFESEHIYFDFDKSELKPEARAILTKKAEWLRANPGFSVRIEGHCDERGTNEYNLALGERRADAAWKFLNALGVSSNRMTTVSYGEERPAVAGHNEAAWSKNRRDQFKLIK